MEASDANPLRDSGHEIGQLKQRIEELEAALLKSQQHFRTVTDSAPVGIFLDDAQGKAIYINKKCAELVGVPAEDALNFNWIPFLHPEDRELMVSEWEKAFKNSTEFRLEYRWVHADGKVVWTLGEVIPIFGDDGKAAFYIGTLTDITARKEAELEREKLHAQLVQAQKMESIGRLAGGVAHDYNNMLNAIICFTELAMAELDPLGSAHKKLQEALKAAHRSAEITRQLLGFARKQMITPKVFDVNESVTEMLKMLRHLLGEHIDLVWQPQGAPIYVKMDHSQFDQMVVNLCINGRDAIEGGGRITIETAVVALDEEYCKQKIGAAAGDFMVLSISDNGCGMNQEVLQNIFEPFFTTKDENKGTGLGLASVYGTVKQNSGFIDVQSTPGAGATFRIYLPLHSEQRAEAKTAVSRIVRQGQRETILIVEDEPAILEIVQCILEKWDYQVLTAGNLSEALEAVMQYREEIVLLITDVVMPEINGRDLAARLREFQPEMKCLYMSGYTADILASQGGFEECFIQKPFSIDEFVSKVQEALECGPTNRDGI